jgi:periplasmic divalent cation tolerance protein
MNELILVITTSDDVDELHSIAAAAVTKKLAACCQVSGPITSHYVWDEKLERSQEFRCEFKTTVQCYRQLESMILEQHHYDEPEILRFNIDGGSDGYAQWVRKQVG